MRPVYATLLIAAVTAATPATAPAVQGRDSAACYAGETKAFMCYRAPSSVPQNLRPSDVLHAARSLRAYGIALQPVREPETGAIAVGDDGSVLEEPVYSFLNMTPAGGAADCGEWTIWDQSETAMITAKLMTTSAGGLVWYGDIANVIDGGLDANGSQRTGAGIASCGPDGGSQEVRGNLSHPAYQQYLPLYQSREYVAGWIVIKVVENRAWKRDHVGWELLP